MPSHPIKGNFKWTLPWGVLKDQGWWVLDITGGSGALC